MYVYYFLFAVIYAIANTTSRMEMNEEPLVETAAKIFQELVYSYRSSLMAGLIIAGWDRRKGGQVITNLLSSCP